MHLSDIFNEAISATHMTVPLEQAVRKGIISAIGSLYDMKGGYPRLEAEFDKGYTSDFTKQMLIALNSSYDQWNMAGHVARAIKEELTKQLGKNVVKQLNFADTKDAYGWATSENEIAINEKIIKSVAKRSLDNVMQIVLDNYGEGELTDGFWFIIKSIGRNERDYLGPLFDRDIKSRINKIAKTTVHEVVHVLQHKRQDEKGLGSYEYRSYLDKKKGEFAALHNKRWTTASPDTDEKYHSMYLASPQEMTAHAHEVVINIIRDYDLNDAETLEQFNNELRTIDAEGVADYTKDKLGNRFLDTSKPREYAVYKRYLKQVYQELHRYIVHRKEYLSKNLNERAIGKKMGHDLYVHKNYVDQTPIPQDALQAALARLPEGYDFTAIKYNKQDGSFSFIQSPDFDTADEPTVGVSLKVAADGSVKRTNPPSDPWIWHNKWMWVGDDYPGFDVEQAKQRSKHWKDIIGVDKAVSSRIGKKSYWDTNIVPKLKS